MITKLNSLLISLALAASLHQAAAQGTAFTFTYQGRLNDGTNPANGKYDFQFQVFDAATAGASYGSPNPNTVAGVGVSNGLFTVTLDFGSSVFTGPARWLQTSVRTNGSASYTLLNARQALTATPYAIYAGNAATLGGQASTAYVAKTGDTMTGTLNLPANGLNVGGGQIVAAGGYLGIGTTSPAFPLQVQNSVNLPLLELSQTSPANWAVLSLANSSGSQWYMDETLGSTPGLKFYAGNNFAFGSDWSGTLTVSSNAIVNGNVGIGTTTPGAELEVVNNGTYARLGGSFTKGGDFPGPYYYGVYGNSGITSTLSIANDVNYAGYFDGEVQVNGLTYLQGDLYVQGGLHFPNAGADTATPVFTHMALAANVIGNKTYINNRFCNGRPDAILIITENWNAGNNVGNSKVVGVYYDAGAGQWTIFVDDGTAMPIGVAYNVMVTLP